VGDQVLAQIGWTIRQIIRETDLLGRYGGDEFLLLLPDTTRSQALALAGRICGAIAARRFESDSGPVQVTVSIGLANAYPSRNSVTLLLRKADQALYRAKNAGRNRVGFLLDSNQPEGLSIEPT
jgi:diguanylate cyclase (GGDEF)-like protein